MKLPLAFLIYLISISAFAESESPPFLGEWIAHSRATQAIFGNMVIRDTHIQWREKAARYEILFSDENAMLIRVLDKIHCGDYLRIGPYKKTPQKYSSYLEFVFYKTERLAKEDWRHIGSGSVKANGYCSFGVYTPT